MLYKNKFSLIISVLLVIIGILIFNKCKTNKLPANETPGKTTVAPKKNAPIDALTKETVVVAYVKKNKALPDYYITKQAAKEKGWDAASGNLCEVLPGKAIGGDSFGNREGQLPKAPNRKWTEADLNYNCGRRNADRLVFSNDGLIYVTNDHYKTFNKK